MSSKTKIVVLKSKELIYTAIFVVLGILLLSLLFYMFSPSKSKKAKDKNNTSETSVTSDTTEILTTETMETIKTSGDAITYKSGVYSSIMNVGQTELQLVVTVDNEAVSHIDITNLNDSVTAMYPLISPSLEEINAQLAAGVSFENLTYSKDNQYTTILILQAVNNALNIN